MQTFNIKICATITNYIACSVYGYTLQNLLIKIATAPTPSLNSTVGNLISPAEHTGKGHFHERKGTVWVWATPASGSG